MIGGINVELKDQLEIFSILFKICDSELLPTSENFMQ